MAIVSQMWRIGTAILAASFIAGCSWLPEVKDETASWSVEKL